MSSKPKIFRQKSRMFISPQDGFIAAEWSACIALLLFPAFVFIATAIQVPARQSLSQAASSAAARAYVQVLDQDQAGLAARAAAESVIRDEYPGATDIDVDVVSSSYYCPGNEVTIRVGIYAPVVINPFGSNSSAAPRIKIYSSSTERIDDYSEVTGADVEDDVKCPL